MHPERLQPFRAALTKVSHKRPKMKPFPCFPFLIPTVRMPVFCALLVAVLAANAPSHSAEKGTLIGQVASTETGRPLQGVHISVINKLQTANTDSNGQFVLNLPAGTFLLGARYAGYDILHQRIEIKAGKTLTVQLDLDPIVMQISEMVTSGQQPGRKTLQLPISVVVAGRAANNKRETMPLHQLIESIVPPRVF